MKAKVSMVLSDELKKELQPIAIKKFVKMEDLSKEEKELFKKFEDIIYEKMEELIGCFCEEAFCTYAL